MISANILLDSFFRATRGKLNSGDQEGEGGTSSGGLSYHTPGMDNGILAPDAFSHS